MRSLSNCVLNVVYYKNMYYINELEYVPHTHTHTVCTRVYILYKKKYQGHTLCFIYQTLYKGSILDSLLYVIFYVKHEIRKYLHL